MARKPARTEAQSERRQVAALPWSFMPDGVRILMITSRDTGRWVIPKGGRMAGLTDAESAAQEALEEAGVIGRIGASPIGAFRYMKILKRRAPRPMLVSVYALEVTALLDDWQEIGQRVRHWMTPEEAAESVDEPDLAQVILAFSREV